AASRIRQEVDEEANIILGATFDSALDGVVRVSVVATGIDQATIERAEPLPRSGSRSAAAAQTLAAPPPQPVVAPEPEPVAEEMEDRPEPAPVAAIEEMEPVEDYIPPAPEPIVR